MDLPDLFAVGVLTFFVSLIVLILVLYLKRKELKGSQRVRERITAIIAFSAALAFSSFLGVNAIHYGIYLKPYPGETLSGSLRAAIVIGAVALVWFSINSVLGGLEEFFESGEAQTREKEDFRSAVARELYTILKEFAGERVYHDIDFQIWSSRTGSSKIMILGTRDFDLLKHFYDRMEERSKYFVSRRGFSVPELDPLNKNCVQALSRAFTEIEWIREFVPDMVLLLPRAKKHVGL